jgi:hypothetical protein
VTFLESRTNTIKAKSEIMSANTISRITTWQQMLARLPWNPKHAERSTKLALSKANWMGIDRNVAIQQVFEMGLGGFFQANPHIPYQTWQAASDEIANRGEFALEVV